MEVEGTMKKILVLLYYLAAATLAHSEGVEGRVDLPNDAQRIRGADTVLPLPWGFVALGGSVLRQLPFGKTKWETLYRIPGDNLYRYAADERGRLVATWENDPNLHVFVPKTKSHTTFPKPSKYADRFRNWILDAIYFDKKGDLIVYMEGMTGSCTWSTVCYRYTLEKGARPRFLFEQQGHTLYQSVGLGVYAYSKNLSRGCDYQGCSPLTGIVTYEIQGDRAIRREIFHSDGEEYHLARLIWGSKDDRLGVMVEGGYGERFLLRWAVGREKADRASIGKGHAWEDDRTWLAPNGDMIDTWLNDKHDLVLDRKHPSGGSDAVTLRSFGFSNPDIAPDWNVYAFKERKNGEMFLHWGDHIILFPKGKAPQAVNIEPLLKRRNEWAGADIYRADPEGLWVGIEVGAGRDFVHLDFADLERQAKPMR
jgi:hypothetical protein